MYFYNIGDDFMEMQETFQALFVFDDILYSILISSIMFLLITNKLYLKNRKLTKVLVICIIVCIVLECFFTNIIDNLSL